MSGIELRDSPREVSMALGDFLFPNIELKLVVAPSFEADIAATGDKYSQEYIDAAAIVTLHKSDLQKLGIESTLLCVPFVPIKLTFLGSMGTLHIVSPFYSGDKNTRNTSTNTLFEHFSEMKEDFGALVVLDCAGINQIPEEAWSIGKDLPYKINIDHHAGYELQSPCGRTLNLVLDFDFIENGAARGAPKYMEWYAAFGLMVTLIWLYIEILRLLAKLRGRR